jgi:pimeloyl-ACP methyl ester carboxylesterase
MARLVLVHGAFGGAWWWDRVIEPLEAAGHTVECFDLPCAGADMTPAEEATLETYVERVAAQLGRSDEPAVLVAHSMGGVVATQTAAWHREKVAAIVYVAAFVPRDGQSLLDLTGLPEGAGDQIQANLIVEGPVARLEPSAMRMAGYAETSDEEAEWAIPQHRPQPGLPFAQKVEIAAGAFEGLPRRYVICTRDCAIPPPLQRRMVAENGIEDVIEIETDHSPAFSRTEELIAAINRLASLEPSAAG